MVACRPRVMESSEGKVMNEEWVVYSCTTKNGQRRLGKCTREWWVTEGKHAVESSECEVLVEGLNLEQANNLYHQLKEPK